MTLTNAEQYLLELINRARLDPNAEAARFGIDLNANLTPGRLDGTAKQVLAPSEMLEQAAVDHTLWMLDTDVFSHTGAGGSQPWDRAGDAGYVWSTAGENISYRATSAPTIDLAAQIASHHQGLFLSAGHRTNILNDGFRELGLGQEAGVFTTPGSNGQPFNWTASMLTQLFGTSGSARFVTGVAYGDADGDRFYSMGEGQAGVTFASGAISDATAAAGGYALALSAGPAVVVTGSFAAGRTFSVTVDLSDGNVKLDLVNGTEFFASGSLTLGTGIQRAMLLGVEDLSLTGTAAVNVLTGNAGDNLLQGLAGNDVLTGGFGDDRAEGGDGHDRLFGGSGRDLLIGGLGNDILRGGGASDRLWGDQGDDTLTGDAGPDRFVFSRPTGDDLITDFDAAEGDILMLRPSLWANAALTAAEVVEDFARIDAGEVLFDFGTGGSIRLAGVTSTAGLADAISLF